MPATTMEDVRPTCTSTPEDHRALIVATRSVRDALHRDDLDTLADAVHRLRRAVTEHVESEATQLDHLAGAAPALTRYGHERVLTLVDRLLDAATEGDAFGCRVAAAALEHRLHRQARLESVLFRRRPAPIGD